MSIDKWHKTEKVISENRNVFSKSLTLIIDFNFAANFTCVVNVSRINKIQRILKFLKNFISLQDNNL